jgi:hypothetical protein
MMPLLIWRFVLPLDTTHVGWQVGFDPLPLLVATAEKLTAISLRSPRFKLIAQERVAAINVGFPALTTP